MKPAARFFVSLIPLLPLGVVAGCDGTKTAPKASGDAGSVGGSNGGNSGNGGNTASAGGAETSNGGSSSAGTGGTTEGNGGDGNNGDGGALPEGDSGPPAPWVNVTNNLVTLAAGGGDVGIVSAEPGTNRVIAGVAKGKGLFVTVDGGSTWSALGTGAGSASINNGPTAIIYDPDHKGTWWEVGIYGDGVFNTTDDGNTFVHLGDSTHNDLVSIDFTDPQRKTLLAGAHEVTQKLFLSRDGGGTWTDIGPNLPADSNFSTLPLIIDTQTFLVGSCGYASGACGVFRSTTGGSSWTSVTTEGPAARPLWASNGTIYWTLYNDGGMITSTDSGKTWTKTAAGPVQLYYSSSPVELPDGRVVTLGSDHLLATSNAGETWEPIGAPLPYPGANCGTYGLTYSANLKTFFINHNDCTGNIIPNSVYSAAFDYTKR